MAVKFFATSVFISTIRCHPYNPRDWRIEDLKALADQFGLVYRQPGSSHVTFRSDRGLKLTVPAHKSIKPVYVKKFLDLIEEVGELE